MATELSKQTFEIETCVGSGTSQALARGETLVPGAGREAIEVLLADALAAVSSAEVQTDRMVVEGTVRCQAAYRQGSETTLRAVQAQTGFSQVFDMPGTAPGMTARACAAVEHVEARYENGHMVFQVTVAVSAQALSIVSAEAVTDIQGEGTELQKGEVKSCRLAAETKASVSVRDETGLPAALDARTALMEWGGAWVESWERDLGGVRVKGRINVETLISSGVEGRPAASVRNTMPFEQLVEVPEWLSEEVCAEVFLTRLETRVEQGGDHEDSVLVTEADVGICVTSIGRETVGIVTDAYAAFGNSIEVTGEERRLCSDVRCLRCTEQIKGTLLLSENAPGVGSVTAVCVHPNVSGWSDGSTVEGVIEAIVLYMPGGSDTVTSARSEMPFSVKCAGELNGCSMVCLTVLSAEASTLMSDRVELRCTLGISAFTREEMTQYMLTDAAEGAAVGKRPGIILVWPSDSDSLWSLGRRYSMPVSAIMQFNGGSDKIEPGKAIVIKQ